MSTAQSAATRPSLNSALRKNFLSKITAWLCYILLTLLLVDGSIQQAEIALFRGQVPYPTAYIKIALLILLAASFMQLRHSKTPAAIMLPWVVFVVYLLVETWYLQSSLNLPLDYVFFSFDTYYYYLLLFPLFFAVADLINRDIIESSLMVLIVPLSAIGLAQYIANAPLLPVNSIDHYFQVQSWIFWTTRHVRGFSLFNSGASFGHYLAWCSGVFISGLFLGKRQKKIVWTIPLVVTFAATYATLTRQAYLETLLTVVAAVIAAHAKKTRHLLHWLAPVYGLLGLVVALGLPGYLVNLFLKSSLLSQQTLLLRYIEWQQFSRTWLSHGLAMPLLGTGIIQNTRYAYGQGVIIDNVLLAVGYHIGLLGCVLYLWLMWAVWRHVVDLYLNSKEPLAVGTFAFCSTWMFTSVFGINIAVYPAVASVLVLGYAATPKRAPSLRVDSRLIGKPREYDSGTGHVQQP